MVELISQKSGKYSFVMKSKVGGLLLKSIDFGNKNEINQTLLELRQNEKINFERKTNYQGDFQFHLKNKKGKIIASSQSYSYEAGMENGMKNVTKAFTMLKLP